MGWLEASAINIGCARGDPYIKKVIFTHTHTHTPWARSRLKSKPVRQLSLQTGCCPVRHCTVQSFTGKLYNLLGGGRMEGRATNQLAFVLGVPQSSGGRLGDPPHSETQSVTLCDATTQGHIQDLRQREGKAAGLIFSSRIQTSSVSHLAQIPCRKPGKYSQTHVMMSHHRLKILLK